LVRILPWILQRVRTDKKFQNKWCDQFIGTENTRTHRAREITINGILKVDMNALIQGLIETLNNTIVVKPPKKDQKYYLIYGEKDPVMDVSKGIELFRTENTFCVKKELHTPNRLLPIEFNKMIKEIMLK
jgi:hypothetical protein